MLALPAPLPSVPAKRPGRPASEAPRDCVAYARLTTPEYNALLSMVPRGASLSDLCRELLSEAVIARLRARERGASVAAPV
jgi:hypothetical protein